MIHAVSRPLTALALSAALALLIAACGSSSSSTTTATPSTQASTPGATTTTSTPSSEASTPTTTPQSTPSSTTPSTPSSSQSPENSIKGYGSAASSAQKTALAAAAFSFFKAMAASDYPKICTDISASNRKELAAFSKAKPKLASCPCGLKDADRHPRRPRSQEGGSGQADLVRVKGPTAFVIFAPKGGKPSYFVLKREAGAWRAISLAPGSPLNPVAGIGK